MFLEFLKHDSRPIEPEPVITLTDWTLLAIHTHSGNEYGYEKIANMPVSLLAFHVQGFVVEGGEVCKDCVYTTLPITETDGYCLRCEGSCGPKRNIASYLLLEPTKDFVEFMQLNGGYDKRHPLKALGLEKGKGFPNTRQYPFFHIQEAERQPQLWHQRIHARILNGWDRIRDLWDAFRENLAH